jgi:mannose-6-phosphate isomerase-like protein (cupin superfamily)
MRIARADNSRPAKGWYLELAHPVLPCIGFANQGIDEPHYHRELWEVYLVATGTSTIVVDDTPIALGPGDVIVVEPGEVHTFAESTPDYFHFVLHCPPITGDKWR